MPALEVSSLRQPPLARSSTAHSTALAQALGEDLLEGRDQSRVAVGNAEQRRPQPPLVEVEEVVAPSRP